MSKSTKVSNPNSKGGSGFIWAIVAVIAIAAVVINYIVMSGQGKKTEHLAEREHRRRLRVRSPTTPSPCVPRPGGRRVDLYEDFSCPYCASWPSTPTSRCRPPWRR